MIELTLILGLAGLACVISAGLARWSLSQAEGSVESNKVAAAVVRASVDFGWRLGRWSVALAVLVGCAFASSGWLLPAAARGAAALPGVDAGAGLRQLLVGVLVGGVSSLLCGQLCLHIAPRAASRVASSVVRTSHTQGVALGLRAGASVALGAEVLALVPVGALLMLCGGVTASVEQLTELSLGLGGLSLGALAATLVTQGAAAALHAAGQQGRREVPTPGARERFCMNAQNPSLILDLVGQHVGVSAVRAQSALCTALLTHTLCIGVAAWSLPKPAGVAPALSPLVLLTLPVLARALGVIASALAVLSLRADEGDEPSAVLSRGHWAAALLSLAGLLGACVWITPGQWLSGFVAGGLGVLCSVLSSPGMIELTRASDVGAQTRAAGMTPRDVRVGRASARALSNVAAPLLLLALAVFVAASFGHRADPVGGALFALSMLVCGFGMTQSFSSTLALFDPVVDTACGLSSLDEAYRRPEAQQRAARLSQTALSSGSRGQSQLGSSTALLGAVATFTFASALSAAGGAATAPSYWAVCATFAGVAAVLGLTGATTLHVARCMERVSFELQQVTETWSHDVQGRPSAPAEFRPRYAETLAAASDRALHPTAIAGLGALFVPLALVVLGGTAKDVAPLAWLGGLAAFATAAALAGGALSLCATSAWQLLSAARRPGRSAADAANTLDPPDLLAELSGNVVGPTGQLVAKGALAACFAAAPLLF